MKLLPRVRTAMCLVGAMLLACKQENQVYREKQTDVFYQSATDKVDILWVVDNSASMADEQAEVARRFQDFISSIQESGLDFHIGVVTTDMQDPHQRGKLVHAEGEPTYLTADTPDLEAVFEKRVQVGVDGSQMEKGIDAAYTALSEPLVSSVNDGFLRDGAYLSIIYVSDENDCTDHGALGNPSDAEVCYEQSDKLVPVHDLIDAYKTLKSNGDRILVSAIVGPEVVVHCDGAVPGPRYWTMANAFGGLVGSICAQSFADIMSQIGIQASGLLDSFQLSYDAVEDTIEVYVDDRSVDRDPQNGWTYDAEYAIVYFHGDAVPPRDSKIEITYEIAH